MDGSAGAGRVADGDEDAVVHALVAQAPEMGEVLALVERAAGSRVPVLIHGETGTGKELVARAVHARGPRAGLPFLVQSCAALPETLLESELFGHVRGAFTGALHDRPGLFVAAGDGTVFLDEIGEAPPALQAKLLRVLQHGEAKPVGADRPRAVRARIVAATNRPLDAEVRAGRFRADLYWRLAVFPITLPPLRRRVADVAPLALHFLRRAERSEGRPTGGLDAEALAALAAYPWPGNVRELENEIRRLVLSVRPGARIGRHQLAVRIRAATRPGGEPLAHVLRRVETTVIRERLQTSRTKAEAARSLGITREALYAKMRRLGLTA
jgi:two-component system response regulator HupR/HoxA